MGKLTTDLGYGMPTLARELLQNIDDAYLGMSCEAPWVRFDCEPGRLVVSHEGRRFNQMVDQPGDGARAGAKPDDLRGICSLGASEKGRHEQTRQTQIGRFGLGFKSVFEITGSPVVLSHPYYFRIDHLVVPEWLDPRTELRKLLPGQSWPEWVEKGHRRTYFILAPDPKSPEHGALLAKLTERLTSGTEDLRAIDLLFLRRLCEARVCAGERGERRVSRKPTAHSFPGVTGASAQAWQLLQNDAPASTFLVLSGKGKTQVEVGGKKGEEELEYGVAFPWDSTGGQFAKSGRACSGLLYLFLPTAEATGLPFHIHGQFLTNLGRTDISGTHPCNAYLASCIAELVRQSLMAAFAGWSQSPPKLRTIYQVAPTAAPQIIPTGVQAGQVSWLDGIRNAFATLLDQGRDVILTDRGSLVSRSKCRLGSPLVHEIHRRLEEEFGKRVVADELVDQEIEPDLERILRHRPVCLATLDSPDLALSLFQTGQDLDPVVRTCRTFLLVLFEQTHQAGAAADGYERYRLIQRLSELPCFPDTAGGICRPIDLPPADLAPEGAGGRWANIAAVSCEDDEFREWILNTLRWAPVPERTRQIITPVEDELIEETYLPFTPAQLRQHFAPISGEEDQDPDRHLQYYLASAERYRRFRSQYGPPPWRGRPISQLKAPCQIEKDERFWLATCLMTCYHEPSVRTRRLADLMRKCFRRETPPLDGLPTWEECFEGDLHLYFEVNLPSPKGYKRWLREKLRQRQIIPYVFDAAHERDCDDIREHREGRTHVDALLLNGTNGFGVVFEGKVLSDVSYQITFDVLRNQIARNIDVMLEKNDTLPEPLSLRRPDRTLFALLTPEIFRRLPQSRLYGLLLPEYRDDPTDALKRDLPHRKEPDGPDATRRQGASSCVWLTDAEWRAVASRLGWLTWEDCQRVWPWAKGRLLESLTLH